MTKIQVLSVMGKYTADFDDGPVPNPAFSEAETKDGSVYETMYFVTSHHPPFVPIRKFQTTAVRFKDGKVTGWGPPD